MSFEATPPNEFRASLRQGRRGPLLVDKHAKVDPSADGLGAVKVPRTETRRYDQRDGDRHHFEGEQTFVRFNGKTHQVELINLSEGGAMVAGTFATKLWDKVELVLGEGGAVECAVRWIRDGKIGLEFAHETQIDCDPATRGELLREVIRSSFPDVELKARTASSKPADEHDEKRVTTRHALIWSGILHCEYQWEAVRLRNISASGALIECALDIAPGAAVSLDLKEAGRVAAQVCWRRGDQMGLSFKQPFDVCLLAQVSPVVASKTGAKSRFASDGRACEQSPWAPQWNRLSVDELGAELGG